MNTFGTILVGLLLIGVARAVIMALIGIILTIIDFKRGDF